MSTVGNSTRIFWPDFVIHERAPLRERRSRGHEDGTGQGSQHRPSGFGVRVTGSFVIHLRAPLRERLPSCPAMVQPDRAASRPPASGWQVWMELSGAERKWKECLALYQQLNQDGHHHVGLLSSATSEQQRLTGTRFVLNEGSSGLLEEEEKKTMSGQIVLAMSGDFFFSLY